MATKCLQEQKTQIQNGGRDVKLFSRFQLIHGPKSGVSAPQQKQILSTCYREKRGCGENVGGKKME
jgi:hypothetical protein